LRLPVDDLYYPEGEGAIGQGASKGVQNNPYFWGNLRFVPDAVQEAIALSLSSLLVYFEQKSITKRS